VGHPFPSSLVALAVGGLVLIEGGDAARALLLALAMVGFQVSIGATNDLADRALDALAKPWKPLPAGRVSAAATRRIALVGYLMGAALSFMAGFAPLLVGLVGHGLGLAYDLRLKRAGWGWLAFALALPLVPIFAWTGAGAGLPPRLGALVPLGALAGLQLALANELVDLDADAAAHGRGLAVRLGRRRASVTMLVAAAAMLSLAGLTFSGASSAALAVMVAATGATALGAVASMRSAPRWRWLGWQAQALGVALLALAWISAARA
jgi:4-hydroxybenzoate polyprenyltransferase